MSYIPPSPIYPPPLPSFLLEKMRIEAEEAEKVLARREKEKENTELKPLYEL